MKRFVESFLCETMASLYYKISTLKKGYNIQNAHKSHIFCADNVYLLCRVRILMCDLAELASK